jgi:hypothetical protein
VLDAYLCLLHLTAGIFVEALFNTFATAAFFKFVIFSIFEMRYLLIIWKARPIRSPHKPRGALCRERSTAAVAVAIAPARPLAFRRTARLGGLAARESR